MAEEQLIFLVIRTTDILIKQSLALARMNPLRLRAPYKRFPSSWIEILSLNINVSDS